MEMIDPRTAREYVLGNYPNDPLLRTIVLNLLEQLPTVEAVEAVRGRWEPHMEEMVDFFGKVQPVQTGLICSNCGTYSILGGNYCSSCGADMRERDADG